MKSFYQFNLKDLEAHFELHGLHPSVAGKLFNWHYKKRRIDPCLKDISKLAQKYISEHINFDLPQIHTLQESDGKTVKFLFRLHDGKKIETVLLPSNKKYAVCLSSQVGCAMKCSFCHTGLQGLSRHLETSEIVGQLVAAQRWLTQNRPEADKIETLVFMGQGEPLHNFDAVKKACEIFLSQHGISLAHDKITISTAGFLPGLERWKDEMPGVNLALSLHAVDSSKRDELIPINTKYPIQRVLEVIDDIPRKAKSFVIYEYLLAKGFNDSKEDALKLAQTLKGKRAFVNIIPFNPFPGSKYERPGISETQAFKDILDQMGITSLVRFTKGDEILAACGQLNSKASP